VIRRLLARCRLEFRFWPGWVSYRAGGRQVGPRPLLGLHRTPDPLCPDCGGAGQVMCGGPGAEEPDFDACHCTPFFPLASLWLPKWTAARYYRRRAATGYSDEPPF